MGKSKVTPEAFNEAAWNLGLPFRWQDQNKNGIREEDEVSVLSSHSFTDVFLESGSKDNVLKIIEEAATGKHLKVARTLKYIKALDKKIEQLQNGSAPELLRQALRDRDMAHRSWAEHTIDFSKLSVAEQKAAWILLNEVVPSVEAVHALQMDPNNLKYFGEIAAQGSVDDYLHAWNNGGPWCQEIPNEACTSHPEGAQARIPNAGQWPESYTKENVAVLEANPDAGENKNFLSDFVNRYLKQGQLEWRSINADPALRPHLEAISAGLREAAAVAGIDPSLKKFFETRAAEFEKTDGAFPYFDGDLAWIAIKGGVDVTLGFYEEEGSHFGHTALMQSFIGPVDQKREEMGRRFQGLVSDMDQGIAQSLGTGYTPRDFSKGLPPLKFAELVSSGDARISYVPAAYYLPNVAPYGDNSASKKVFASNNIAARYQNVYRFMGEVVIHPYQRNVSEEDYTLFVIGHENAHGVGVDYIHTKSLGEYSHAIEEAKADLEGLTSLPLAIQKGIVTQAQADKAAIAFFYGILRGLAYGMSDPHGVGSIIEFTSLCKEGGLVEKEGYYMVNLKNGAFFDAAKKVARRMEQIQFKSGAQGKEAKQELADWLEESKQDMPLLMKNKFLPILEQMSKDVFPWYHFKFSPTVVAAMTANSKLASAK